MAGRVLIAERDVAHCAALETELLAACYDVTAVTDAQALSEFLESGAPDVLMIGIDMLSDDVLGNLRHSRDGQDTAVVGLIETGQDRAGALMSGLDEALARPVGGAFLQARLRSLIRSIRELKELRRNQIAARDFGLADPAQPWRPAPVAALVSVDETRLAAWTEALGNIATTAFSPDEILTVGRRASPAPDAIVFELGDHSSDADGLALLAELRNRQATCHTPILVVLSGLADQRAAMALDLGADDVVQGPTEPDELRLRVDRLLTQKEELDALRAPVEESLRLASIDAVTGVYNRRYAENALRDMARVPRSQFPGGEIAIMIADLDNFKAVNDRFGHPAGDAVLGEVASRLRSELRPDDLLARYGGEEFLIVMRAMTPDAARRAAERLCTRIRGLHAPVGETAPGFHPVTISIGIAVGVPNGDPGSLDALRCAADSALYSAKAAGRDCVRLARIEQVGERASSGKDAA